MPHNIRRVDNRPTQRNAPKGAPGGSRLSPAHPGGHIVVTDGASPNEVLAAAKHVIDEQSGISLSTIQIEPAGLVENDPAALDYQAVRKDAGGSNHAPHDHSQ
jgi:hypothetical protein